MMNDSAVSGIIKLGDIVQVMNDEDLMEPNIFEGIVLDINNDGTFLIKSIEDGVVYPHIPQRSLMVSLQTSKSVMHFPLESKRPHQLIDTLPMTSAMNITKNTENIEDTIPKEKEEGSEKKVKKNFTNHHIFPRNYVPLPRKSNKTIPTIYSSSDVSKPSNHEPKDEDIYEKTIRQWKDLFVGPE